MNYFQPYSLPANEIIVAAWDSQLADCAATPALTAALAKQQSDLFPRFAVYYSQLRALPRGARRALQRRLAGSRDLIAISPAWRRKLARTIAGAALLLTLAQRADAATISVTTNNPEINAADGKCSLIEAIINANNHTATHPDCPAGDSGSNTIVLPKGSALILDNAYTNDTGNTGLPVISSSIILEGNGATLERGKDAPEFRLISIATDADLLIKNITLSGGLGLNGGLERMGAAIINYGTLTIRQSLITHNQALWGAGIFNTDTAMLTVEDSTISGNTALVSGGGIVNFGTTTITNSTISSNTAGGPNSSWGDGGGISNGDRFHRRNGRLNIFNSTISGNTAGGGHDHLACGVNICHMVYARGNGGGIANWSGETILLNSTVSTNRAFPHGRGGGMFNYGEVSVNHSTFTGNSASEQGGGIMTAENTLTLTRTIVSGNFSEFQGPEVAGGNFQSDFNLFGANGNAGVHGMIPGPTDIVSQRSLKKILGPLKNNGGPTKTHAVVKGSPAIDAAPADANCPATDQRGVARPRGGGCDIGAFEK